MTAIADILLLDGGTKYIRICALHVTLIYNNVQLVEKPTLASSSLAKAFKRLPRSLLTQ